MFLFLRLLLAHFIGDFPFQFNFIYRLKLKGLFGIIPHAAIIFGWYVILCWPFLHLPKLWVFLLALGCVHLLQDNVKLKFGTHQCTFWPYVIDQLFHVATIAMLFLTDLRHLVPPENSNNALMHLYRDDKLLIYIIALIIATYNGYFLIRCFKDSYLQRAHYNEFEKWFGKIERAGIVTAFYLSGPWLLALSAVFLMRPFAYRVFRRRFALPRSFASASDTALSWIAALLAVGILYLLQSCYAVN